MQDIAVCLTALLLYYKILMISLNSFACPWTVASSFAIVFVRASIVAARSFCCDSWVAFRLYISSFSLATYVLPPARWCLLCYPSSPSALTLNPNRQICCAFSASTWRSSRCHCRPRACPSCVLTHPTASPGQQRSAKLHSCTRDVHGIVNPNCLMIFLVPARAPLFARLKWLSKVMRRDVGNKQYLAAS
jgi:hypothetical protein